MSNRSRPYLIIKSKWGDSVIPWGHQSRQQRGVAQCHADARGAKTKRVNQSLYELACAQSNEARRAFHLLKYSTDRGTYVDTKPLEDARQEYEDAKAKHHKNFKH